MHAVLPLKILGPVVKEYFADGTTDEIIRRLAGIGDPGVVSSTTAFARENSNPPVEKFSKELDVDYVLDGPVSWDRSGQKMLFTSHRNS